MPQFCHIWCTICGGVLDTAEEDGERRSGVQTNDLWSPQELIEGEDNLEDVQRDEVCTWVYNSHVLSSRDIEVYRGRHSVREHSLITQHSGYYITRCSDSLEIL